MREILFRGKEKDGEKWVFGDLLQFFGGEFAIHYYENEDFVRKFSLIDPETVGQFTGLRDCKRTKEHPEGQMIFEGDIVTIPGSKRMGLPAEIWYNELKTTFEIRRTGFNNISLFEAQEWCEVIGNIYDNPELLRE